MKKNGFVFVETIISIVILTSALLLLYTSFNKILQTEKTRIHYDDVSYIYRTYYIKNQLKNLNKVKINNSKALLTIGLDTNDLFDNDNDKAYISQLIDDFDISQMIIVKDNKIDDIKRCTEDCALNNNCTNYNLCNSVYNNLSDNMITYLKSVYVDLPTLYVFVVEYYSCNDNNCRNYYSWVSV